VNTQEIQIELADLDEQVVELNAEELHAVSGARMSTCVCGPKARTDDWIL
jgi:hypothetical protein